MVKNSMYLYGKNSILERLKVNSKSIKRIYLQDNFKDRSISNVIEATNIPVREVTERELNRVKHADRLQGIVAEVDKFSYTPFEQLLSESLRKNVSLIFLDSINDPHNLGSIIRIAACFGGFALVIPRHSSCEVNDTVMHVASGGENFIPVSLVNNIATSLVKAKKAGYWAVGALVGSGEDINKVSLPFPISLVLGSEGKGIRPGVKKQLDVRVNLPMRGAALSFNVAMAAAIFCHEIVRQRPQK